MRSEQGPATLPLQLLDALPGLAWGADERGELAFVNRAFERFVGTGRARVLHGGWPTLLTPEDHAALRAALLAREVGGAGLRLEAHVRTVDGTLHPVLLEANAIQPDGSGLAWLGSALDLGEQRRYEAKLPEGERRVRQLLDENPIGMLAADPHGRLVYMNPAFRRMTGYDETDLARRVTWKALTPPEYADIDAEAEAELKRTGRVGPYEKAFVHKDGSHVPVLIGATLLQGGPSASVAYVLDLSEGQEAERRARRVQAVALRVSGALDRATASNIALQEGVPALGGSVGVIALPDRTAFLRLEARHGLSSELPDRWRSFAWSTHAETGEAIGERRPWYFTSRAEVLKAAPDLERDLQEAGIEALATFPLDVGDTTGVLIVGFDTPRPFTSQDRALCETLALHLAQALERARLFESERRARQQAEALAALTADLARAPRVADIGDAVLRHALPALQAVAGGVWLEQTDGRLLLVSSRGDEAARVDALAVVQGASPSPMSDAVSTAVPVYVSSRRQYEALYPALGRETTKRAGAYSTVALPLLADGAVVGGLSFEFDRERTFSSEERAFAETIAVQCASALERARLYEETAAAKADAEAALFALSETQQRLRTVTNSDLLGVFFWRLDGAVTHANDTFLRLLGYDRSDLAAGRLRWDDLTPPEWRAQDQEMHHKIRTHGEAATIEKAFYHKDGRAIPVLVGGAPFAGSREAGAAFVLDISERKRLERERDVQRARFAHIAEASPDALFIYDLVERRLVYANREFTELLGYTSREVDGFETNVFAGLVHPDDSARVHDARLRLVRAQDGEVVEAEYRVRHKDGSYRWIRGRDVVFSRDPDGTVREYLGVASDITARKGATAALQDSEERLRLALASAHLGLWDYDFATGREVWMGEQQRLLGLPEGAPPQWATFVQEAGEEDRARLMAAIDEAMHGSGTYDAEFRVRRDGEERWLASVGQLYRDEAGVPRRMTGITFDVTERKRAEEMLRGLNTELERRVEERTLRLSELNAELTAYATSLSHDLQAPLRRIAGFVHLLDKRLKDVAGEKVGAYLDVIKGESERVSRLVEDLAGLAYAGRQELRLTTVPLDQLAVQVRSDLEPISRGRRVTWQMGDLPSVKGDAMLLRQVLTNLMHNALKFTRERDAAKIELGAQVAPEEVVLFVRDNGVGFHLEDADKLFRVFVRLHDGYEGAGVGLANVRRIVARHGGRVWAEGVPGQGATFYLALPR
ncbi:PAS domain S-box protein [Deinococcus yavapaiensis]|uniref:histidine kinase n=1 Tax=Deinococcus yavapaiensis KR-236 TaxID=694435 RepID=A0A318SJ22_9DEIO|nr:PAS domain S-box protein [Deinococcus yavapaiensis]PYE51923.1 PAS domain S-box-containing protein [Deinococcus yavapaiensis KR-236]